MTPEMMKSEEVAAKLGVSRREVFKLPIEYYKIGKRTYRWKISDVEAYIDSRPRKLEILERDAILAKALPAANTPGVYFLLLAGEIVYIGQSICPFRRFSDHIADKKFDAYVFLPCERRDLVNLESYYIGQYKPKYNKVGYTRYEDEEPQD